MMIIPVKMKGKTKELELLHHSTVTPVLFESTSLTEH